MADSSLGLSKKDPRAFGEFYREHAAALTRFFARRVIDPEAALDLTAETFAQAYASRGRFHGRTVEQERAWLYTIAQRQLSGYYRRGYAEREMLSRLGVQWAEPDAEELRRVEELGAMRDLRELVGRQVQELPEASREAVRLRVIEELPYVEVAERLAITETAARMRVSRALSQLRAVLAPDVAVKEI